MKKNYLMMAMAAAMLASCAQTGVIEDVDFEETPQAIGFNTFADKQVRATENSDVDYTWIMENHHETFHVWGYKNTAADPVFANVEVSHSGSAWEYTGIRFWDKAATDYYFYACAPVASFAFSGTQENGKFTVGSTGSDYVVNAVNISPKTSIDPQASWKGESENDLMIAAPCHLSGASLTTAYTSGVQLNFIHILSRLNIVINKKVSDDYNIVVNKITVGNMLYKGTFDEGTASIDNTVGVNNRWTKTADKTTYEYPIEYSVPATTGQDNYVIEALIMPQTTEVETVALDGTGTIEDAYIKIEYTLTQGGNAEKFEAFYNLAAIFGVTGTNKLAFNEGWQNTLNITLSPAAITFKANVALWDESANKDLTVN